MKYLVGVEERHTTANIPHLHTAQWPAVMYSIILSLSISTRHDKRREEMSHNLCEMEIIMLVPL